MKFSPFYFTINIIVVVFAAVIVVPSLHFSFAGRDINFDGLDLSNVCAKKTVIEETGETLGEYCFPNFKFQNTGDFTKRDLIKYEFMDLNNEKSEGQTDTLEALAEEAGLDLEELDLDIQEQQTSTDEADESLEEKESDKDEIFNRNIDIIEERLKIAGLSDTKLQKIINEDGKRYIELYTFDVQGLKQLNLNELVAEGEIEIYEDIENYTQPEVVEGEEEVFPDYLEGKQISSTLSIDDVQRVGSKFDPTLAGGQGGFVLILDFGDENTDKVIQAAKKSFTTEIQYPGIQIVQNGYPVAYQAQQVLGSHESHIQQGYSPQSHIVFAGLGDPKNSLQTRVLTSIISTDPIDTAIVATSIGNIDPIFENDSNDFIKVAIVIAIASVSLLSIIFYGKKGIALSLIFISQSIFFFALSQALSQKFDIGFVLGYLGAMIFSILYFLRFISGGNKIEENYIHFKQNFWMYLVAIMFLFSVWAMASLSDVILMPFYGFLLFVISYVFTIEVGVKSWIPLIIKYKNN